MREVRLVGFIGVTMLRGVGGTVEEVLGVVFVIEGGVEVVEGSSLEAERGLQESCLRQLGG